MYKCSAKLPTFGETIYPMYQFSVKCPTFGEQTLHLRLYFQISVKKTIHLRFYFHISVKQSTPCIQFQWNYILSVKIYPMYPFSVKLHTLGGKTIHLRKYFQILRKTSHLRQYFQIQWKQLSICFYVSKFRWKNWPSSAIYQNVGEKNYPSTVIFPNMSWKKLSICG